MLRRSRVHIAPHTCRNRPFNLSQGNFMPKSSTCFKANGEPLIEFFCEGDALHAAEYAAEKYGTTDLVPYRCSKCELWHLSPRGRVTPSEPCPDCLDSHGRPKEAYEAHADAQRRANIIMNERNVSLDVYECPYGNGWHLTKQGW